jgi:hypothetical protein
VHRQPLAEPHAAAAPAYGNAQHHTLRQPQPAATRSCLQLWHHRARLRARRQQCMHVHPRPSESWRRDSAAGGMRACRPPSLLAHLVAALPIFLQPHALRCCAGCAAVARAGGAGVGGAVRDAHACALRCVEPRARAGVQGCAAPHPPAHSVRPGPALLLLGAPPPPHALHACSSRHATVPHSCSGAQRVACMRGAWRLRRTLLAASRLSLLSA